MRGRPRGRQRQRARRAQSGKACAAARRASRTRPLASSAGRGLRTPRAAASRPRAPPGLSRRTSSRSEGWLGQGLGQGLGPRAGKLKERGLAHDTLLACMTVGGHTTFFSAGASIWSSLRAQSAPRHNRFVSSQGRKRGSTKSFWASTRAAERYT